MNSEDLCKYIHEKQEFFEKILDRKLNAAEKKLLRNVKGEFKFNIKLSKLHKIAREKNMIVSTLTNLHGNCLFESLKYFFECDTDKFREGLATLMLIFKDVKNIIPNQDMSLNELFTIYNDVENVYCEKNKKLYKYNYDTMCIDLATDSSWTRLNTELILMFISTLLNVKIEILHDNSHVTTICSTVENINTMTIYLGQMGEFHYVPLNKITNIDNIKILYHDKGKNKFLRWLNDILPMNNTNL